MNRSHFKHTPKHKQTSNQTILTMFMSISQCFIQLGSKFNHVDADCRSLPWNYRTFIFGLINFKSAGIVHFISFHFISFISRVKSRYCSLVNHSKRQCHPTSDMSLNFPRGGSVTAVDISPWVEVEHQACDLKATNPTMFQQDLGVVQAEVAQVQVAHGGEGSNLLGVMVVGHICAALNPSQIGC